MPTDPSPSVRLEVTRSNLGLFVALMLVLILGVAVVGLYVLHDDSLAEQKIGRDQMNLACEESNPIILPDACVDYVEP